MASVYASEIPEEQAFMSEYWNFRKKYYDAEEPDSYWEELIGDIETISKKYNSLYVDMVLLVCLADIEIRFKKKTNNSNLDPDINQLKHVLQTYENLKGRYDERGRKVGSKD